MKALGLKGKDNNRHGISPGYPELPSRPPLDVDTCRGSEAPPTSARVVQFEETPNNLYKSLEKPILDMLFIYILFAGRSCTNDETLGGPGISLQ